MAKRYNEFMEFDGAAAAINRNKAALLQKRKDTRHAAIVLGALCGATCVVTALFTMVSNTNSKVTTVETTSSNGVVARAQTTPKSTEQVVTDSVSSSLVESEQSTESLEWNYVFKDSAEEAETYAEQEKTDEYESWNYGYETAVPTVESISNISGLSYSEVYLLINLVGREYGSDYVPIEEKARVVATVMNRVYNDSAHWEFDEINTVTEALNQPGQYDGWLPDSYFTYQVTDSCIEAVDFYFRNPGYAAGDYYYYGDGSWNYFRYMY